jgi:ATP-dependent Clp protease ATP-binding subunit ClpB
MFDDLRARLGTRQMTLQISDGARRFIAEQGFDPVYGARPLRRFIAREVETRIARALLGGDVLDGAVIHVELDADDIVIAYENPTIVNGSTSSTREGANDDHLG